MKIVRESIQHRDLYKKTDLAKVDVVYHWINEASFFEICYENSDNDKDIILGEDEHENPIPMPSLPSTKFSFGEYERCMTVDKTYEYAGTTGENYVCLILDFKKLQNDFDIEDLTDNGEAEIRICGINNWLPYLIEIKILKEAFYDGTELEDFFYRPISEYFPKELESKLTILKDPNYTTGW